MGVDLNCPELIEILLTIIAMIVHTHAFEVTCGAQLHIMSYHDANRWHAVTAMPTFPSCRLWCLSLVPCYAVALAFVNISYLAGMRSLPPHGNCDGPCCSTPPLVRAARISPGAPRCASPYSPHASRCCHLFIYLERPLWRGAPSQCALWWLGITGRPIGLSMHVRMHVPNRLVATGAADSRTFDV